MKSVERRKRRKEGRIFLGRRERKLIQYGTQKDKKGRMMKLIKGNSENKINHSRMLKNVAKLGVWATYKHALI